MLRRGLGGVLLVSGASSRSLLSAVGAVLSALASSACCWIPLLLVGFGLSAGGLSAWFEQNRLLFLVLAGGFLALGFYLAYFTGTRCDESCACSGRVSRVQRLSRGLLWISAVVVIAFASFPKYVGALMGDGGTLAAAPLQETVAMKVDGMTCEACAVPLQHALAGVPGVVDARVWYSRGTASLVIDPAAGFDPQDAVDVVDAAGYAGSLVGDPASPVAEQNR